MRADGRMSIEIRVTTAERKAFADAGCVAEAAQRSELSWIASFAPLTLPRIRSEAPSPVNRRTAGSPSNVRGARPTASSWRCRCS
jgi:hypothetical protein